MLGVYHIWFYTLIFAAEIRKNLKLVNIYLMIFSYTIYFKKFQKPEQRNTKEEFYCVMELGCFSVQNIR